MGVWPKATAHWNPTCLHPQPSFPPRWECFRKAGVTESHTFHSSSKEDVRSVPEWRRLAVLLAAASQWGALCSRVTGDFIMKLSNPTSPRISEAALPLLCPAPIPPPRRRIPSLAVESLGCGHVTHPSRPQTTVVVAMGGEGSVGQGFKCSLWGDAQWCLSDAVTSLPLHTHFAGYVCN